jgi:hypothetical protein
MIFFTACFVFCQPEQDVTIFFVLRSLLMNIYVVFLVFHNDILSSVTKKGCPVIKKRKIRETPRRKTQKGSEYPIKETGFIIHLLAFFTNKFAELRPYALSNVQYKFSSHLQM